MWLDHKKEKVRMEMVTAQTLELGHDIKGGVKVVSEELKGVDDKVDQLIEGTFSAVSSSQNVISNLHVTRPRERESS